MLDPRPVFASFLACVVCVVPLGQETALRMKWDELAPEVGRERAARATSVAEAHVRALLNADLEAILRTADVPYAMDRKEVVETPERLREVFQRLTARGPIGLEAGSTEVLADRRGIGDDCLPVDYVIVRVRLGEEGDEHADVCVRMGGEPAVIGFTD